MIFHSRTKIWMAARSHAEFLSYHTVFSRGGISRGKGIKKKKKAPDQVTQRYTAPAGYKLVKPRASLKPALALCVKYTSAATLMTGLRTMFSCRSASARACSDLPIHFFCSYPCRALLLFYFHLPLQSRCRCIIVIWGSCLLLCHRGRLSSELCCYRTALSTFTARIPLILFIFFFASIPERIKYFKSFKSSFLIHWRSLSLVKIFKSSRWFLPTLSSWVKNSS